MSEKSKSLIADALMEILHDNPFEVITISEICDNADLVRKTFYNNFSSKEEVIEYIIVKRIEEYLEILNKADKYNPRDMSLLYFEFWHNHKDFIKVLIESDLFHLLQRQFNNYLPSVGKMIPSSKIRQITDNDLKYIYTFYSAGLSSLLEYWIKSNFKKSPTDMSEIFRTITQGV